MFYIAAIASGIVGFTTILPGDHPVARLLYMIFIVLITVTLLLGNSRLKK